MGQIIIELPNRINRRYRVENQEFAEALIESLELAALPVKSNLSKLSVEDQADIRAARRALKYGEFIAWEDAKAFLDRIDWR